MAQRFQSDVEPAHHFHMCLLQNVAEAARIRQDLMAGRLNATVMKARMVLCIPQVRIAAEAALLAEVSNTKATRSLHSEVLYYMYHSKQIQQAFSTFGIADDDTALLVLAIDYTDDEFTALVGRLGGEVRPLEELPKFTDVAAIRQVYKFSAADVPDEALFSAIVTKMAQKNTRA